MIHGISGCDFSLKFYYVDNDGIIHEKASGKIVDVKV